MSLSDTPFAYLIQVYFPPDQWDNAACITLHEDGTQDPARVSPPNKNGTRDHGLFQINDGVWDPDANPASPFTRAQWASRYDPNVNVWMASVIFSGNGWGDWSTRFLCGLEDVTGRHAIPHPEGPLDAIFQPAGGDTPPVDTSDSGSGLALLLGGILMLGGAGYALYKSGALGGAR